MGEVRQTAAVVVTYKRDELLAQCLRCLSLQTAAGKMDIIVVDNGGAGRSSIREIPQVQEVEEIRVFLKDGGRIIYLDTGENLGGAGGFSLGMEEAVKLGYRLVWVMDDDTQPEQGALEALLEAHAEKNGRYGFLSSQALWKDGTLNRMNIQRRSLTMKVRNFLSPAVPVVMASFVSLLVPASVIKNMGLPIREFGTWTDDWEFTRRISRVYPSYLVNGSRVFHMTGENRGANIAADEDRPVSRYETMYRNDVYLYRREGLNGFIYETRRLIGHWFRIVFTAHEKRKRLGAMFRGTRAGLDFRPEIRYPEAGPGEGRADEIPGGRASVPESGQAGDRDNTTKENKILQVFGEPISFGGEEMFVSEILKVMDTRGLQVDLFTPYYCDNQRIVREMETLGHRVFTRDCPFRPGGARRRETRAMRDVLRASRWDAVHIHSGSVTMLRKYCKLANRAGIPEIVVHAHCAGIPNLSHTLTSLFSRRVLTRYPSRWLACSQAAGEWMFPEKICRERLQVVKNGVDVRRFAFDPVKRCVMRRELGFPDGARVIGFVGRLTGQKNPGFLLSVAEDIRRSRSEEIRLLLVGEGDQRRELEDRVRGSAMDGLVTFAGNVEDPEDYYQAMDVFALPSLFEGFSIAALEAQANGLTVVASTGVVTESQVAENFRRISLDDRGSWKEALMELDTVRTDNSGEIEARGLDIRETARQIRSIY